MSSFQSHIVKNGKHKTERTFLWCLSFFQLNASVLLMVLLFSGCHGRLFCDLVNCNPPGCSVCGTSQARILEWVTISFSQGIFMTQESNSCLLHDRLILYHWPNRESPLTEVHQVMHLSSPLSLLSSPHHSSFVPYFQTPTNKHYYVSLLFLNLFLYWRIIALQNFVVSCQTSTWISHQFSSVQQVSHVWLFATPGTAARQVSLSLTISQSLPKFMST